MSIRWLLRTHTWHFVNELLLSQGGRYKKTVGNHTEKMQSLVLSFGNLKTNFGKHFSLTKRRKFFFAIFGVQLMFLDIKAPWFLSTLWIPDNCQRFVLLGASSASRWLRISRAFQL